MVAGLGGATATAHLTPSLVVEGQAARLTHPGTPTAHAD